MKVLHMERSHSCENLGLVYCAKLLLNEEALEIIYFSYIHFYLNYVVA